MNKHQISKFLQDNGSHILTGTAVLGVAATAYFTAKGTVRALRATDELKREMEQDFEDGGIEPYFLRKRDYVRLNWKFYLPAATCGAATIACLVGAQTVNVRRQASLAAGYTIAQRAYEDYREKVIEKIGDKAEEEVRAEIVQDKVKELAVSPDVLVKTNGEVLCFDTFSSRYFYSTKNKIEAAQNAVNLMVINSMYATMNDFYRELEVNTLSLGDEFGWTTDTSMAIYFSSILTPEDEPVLAIEYHNYPIRNYTSIWN